MSVASLLRMTAPVRDAFDVPYHDIGDPTVPPNVALVAGLHGNELNGVFVLARLAGFLTQVAAGDQKPLCLKGRVVVVPAVNVLGVNTRRRAWPFDGTDINRMFPGYAGGETTQRIASALLDVTAPAARRIDIHSSNLEFEELPQVRLYDPTDAERASARLFGLSAILERRANTIFTSTLGHAWRHAGGENFVIQAGIAGTLQSNHCERVFRALVVFLCRVGVLDGTRIADEDDECWHFGPRQTFPIIAEQAGLFVARAQVGAWLSAGDVLGHVYDAFDGTQHAALRAPVSGLLSGIRRQPLLCAGDLLARIQTRDELADATADTFLDGHGQ